MRRCSVEAKAISSPPGEYGRKAVVEDVASDEVQKKITQVDELLEKFIGIRDEELSTTIYDLAKDAKESDVFAGKLDTALSDFEFPDDFILDVHEIVHS